MPLCVVDAFKVIQIDEKDGAYARPIAHSLKYMVHAFEQQAPVGQFGKRVVVGQSVGSKLGCLVVGNVGGDAAKRLDLTQSLAQRDLDVEEGDRKSTRLNSSH